MIKLQAPQDCGQDISVRGVMLKLDKKGQVEVDEMAAADLESHGFVRIAETKKAE